MANYTCERCADTGIVQAALVKNQETFKNEFIAVTLCSEYSDTTDYNLELLNKTGIEVRIVGKANNEGSTSEESNQ